MIKHENKQLLTISFSPNGPHKVEGITGLVHVDDNPIPTKSTKYLCGSVGSKNKPFYDSTNWQLDFDQDRRM